MRVIMEAENIAKEKNIKLTNQQWQAISVAASAAQDAARKLEGAKITQLTVADPNVMLTARRE